MAPNYLDKKYTWLDASAWDKRNDKFFSAALLSQELEDGQRVVAVRTLLLANINRVEGGDAGASAAALEARYAACCRTPS
jgi:hypothetical protein